MLGWGGLRLSLVGSVFLAALHQFDFVPFRGVDECEAAPIFLHHGTIRKFQAKFCEVFSELFEVFHFEGKMGEVGLHLDRSAGRKITKFDQLLTARRFHKNQLRATGRFMAARFLESQDVLVKFHRFFQVINTVTRVQQLPYFHEPEHTPGKRGRKVATVCRSEFEGPNLKLCTLKFALYSPGMTRWLTCLAFTLLLASSGMAASAKILKVLPHFLDLEGRESLNPSLYERDAYQAQLRRNPKKRSALRFDIQWKSKEVTALRLKVEMRGGKAAEATQAVVEKTERHVGGFTKWTGLTLSGEPYEKFGELVAWRVTLWDGDKLVGEKKSFLW